MNIVTMVVGAYMVGVCGRARLGRVVALHDRSSASYQIR
jgi:hypothetical protein